MITGKGVGALLAAFAIFFLARLTQVGWLYLVDAIFWGALTIGLVMPWVGVVFISARRGVFTKGSQKSGGPLSEGDLVRITVSLQNRLFYPRFFHSVMYDSPIAGPAGAEQRFFVAHLPGSGSLPLESTVEAYQRGLHQLGPLKLESSVPFGFFRKRRSISGPQPLLVLPRVYPLKRMILVDGLDGYSASARASRNAMDQAGSRPYVHGDSRRMVHWRNTARAGRLMVKETEDQTNRTLHIMFDSGDPWGYGRESNFEYAIKLVVSVADYALKNMVPVRLWGSNLRGSNFAAPGSVSDFKGVTLAWPDLLNLLAVAQPTGRAAMGEGLANLPTGANLFVVVAADDWPSHQNLDRALARSGEAVVVRLEGFGEPQSAEDPAMSLGQAGASLLTCNPGGLEQTLTDIENLGRSNDHEAYESLAGTRTAEAGRI
ncbi:MAG: DUF58 domain-containing protein [Chloroflexi bacterium]|nr:DUF58 domain-containing protein [Chloroflexota bacterium]